MNRHGSSTLPGRDGPGVRDTLVPTAKRIVTRILPDAQPLWPKEASIRRVGGTAYARVLLQADQVKLLDRRDRLHVAICQVLNGQIILFSDRWGRKPCGPGEICYWESSARIRVKAIQNAVVLLTFVGRDALSDIGVEIQSSWRLVCPPNMLAVSAARFIEGILEADGTPDPVTAHLVENLTHKLVGSMLLSDQALPAAAPNSDANTYARAIKLMMAQRTNPAVTPVTVAAELHISLRQLQREFSRRGSTVAGALRQLRAELAVSVLRDRAYDVLPISQVAYYSGFTSAQQMRRVLMACGYPTPLDLRKPAERRTPD